MQAVLIGIGLKEFEFVLTKTISVTVIASSLDDAYARVNQSLDADLLAEKFDEASVAIDATHRIKGA